MDEYGGPLHFDSLTKRELEILRLIAAGLSNQDIAERLFITLGTVKWYAKTIYNKLSVASRTQAVAVARASGLLDTSSANPVSPRLPRRNLPPQPTPFVGRSEELATIAQQLEEPTCRLLTLVGPGGIGKTRLALRAAEQRIAQFEHGVYFVSLAPINSPNLVASTIGNALNFSFSAQRTASAQILDYLSEKEILLVLDNFEHLLEGTGLLVDLFGGAPGVKILVTSRERLNLQEEWLVHVQGMDFPTDALAAIENYSAVQLFLQQAQRVQRGFSLVKAADRIAVARICQLVEGMPLGIELASTWLRVMPAEQIADRIAHDFDFLATSVRNVPERHRNIRALFEHSWNLLSAAERSVLMRLSVFRGGFGLKAAMTVAGTSIADMVALIDKSIVSPEREGRYDIHELLRQYALVKLTESGDAQRVKNAHLDFYLLLAQETQPLLEGAEQNIWLVRLDQERHNLRAALHWSGESGALESGLRLGAALWLFWFMRGYLTEGREHLKQLLALATETVPASARAEALEKAGVLARYQGDYTQANALINEGLAIYRLLEDRHGVANALATLGFVALYQNNHALARARYGESLTLNRELANGQGVADSLSYLALIAFYEGDVASARLLDEESLAIWRALSDKQGVAWALHRLGNVILREDPETAHSIFVESLALSQELEYQWGLAWLLEDFARLATIKSDFARALCLAGAATSLRRLIGIPLPPPEQAELDHKLESARSILGQELATVAWTKGQSITLEQALSEIAEIGVNRPKS